LEQNLLYIHEKYDDGNFMILQDNQEIHKSNFVKDWIEENFGGSD
jgi:hypothetical protein